MSKYSCRKSRNVAVFIWVCCYPEENQGSLVRKTENEY